ncbi:MULTISPECIES: FHA domain-containing protein [unclassified Bradyrhizobium]|uniref:FHA domain-containing protein n=1 Tax=unclassified Bradyrhizobium TaxID=2631580 RepID=UPI0028ED98F2|nr:MULTISPECIES: FHA domain-containing protein [unclassified Bradyrhizobium]
MIWVEILSRHRDVVGRFRIDRPEITIGRGYDNDVVVDDPYVAAQHVRIFRDESGRLVAEDLGSANGLYLEKNKSRCARVTLDGIQPIRIGQSLLRIREISHAVEPERLAGSERRSLQIGAALGLGVLLLGIDALLIWIGETSESHASNYLLPSLALFGTAAAWVGMWSLLSRLFAGRSMFLHHVLIAEAGLLAFWLYSEFAQVSSFALTWPGAFTYQYVASWLVIAAVCFLHLREVGRTHLMAKGVVVGLLLVTAIAVQTLQRSEAFANSGRQTVSHVVLPPSLRLVPLGDEGALMGDIEKLKLKLDADRSEASKASRDH